MLLAPTWPAFSYSLALSHIQLPHIKHSHTKLSHTRMLHTCHVPNCYTPVTHNATSLPHSSYTTLGHTSHRCTSVLLVVILAHLALPVIVNPALVRFINDLGPLSLPCHTINSHTFGLSHINLSHTITRLSHPCVTPLAAAQACCWWWIQPPGFPRWS